MNQDVKAKWIAALRSEAFKQGYGALRSPSGYCCLGVLCELHRRETGAASWESGEISVDLTYLGEVYFIPDEVMEWAGLGDNNPDVPQGGDISAVVEDDEPISLSSLNDGHVPFHRIAEVIEKNF